MVKIAISRGHGRSTPGKRSPAGEREWYFNDKVADAFESEIQKYQNVQLNRVSDPNGYTDTPLLTRTNSANRWGATLYVAFHHNALAGRWGRHGGSEVWVRPNAPQAAKLARNVAPRVARAMNIRNRGVKAGNLHEVREPNQHAILIEGGFMDSTIDITAMRRNDMLAAQGRAVAAGVASYYGLKKKSSNNATKKPSKPSKPSVQPKPSTPSKGRGTGGAGNIKYKENKWRYNNATKAHWTPVDATFIVGSDPIYVYDDAPKLIQSNRAPSQAKPGARIKVLELARADGHVWVGYRTGSGQFRYCPIKKWNGGGGRVTNKNLWGEFI